MQRHRDVTMAQPMLPRACGSCLCMPCAGS